MRVVAMLPFKFRSNQCAFCFLFAWQFFVLPSCSSQPESEKYASPRTANLSDSALLDTVEKQTFEYFWSGAETNSGMGREEIRVDNDYGEDDRNIVTSGGSGFGIMGLLAGIERKYIT